MKNISNLFDEWGINFEEPLGLLFDVDELLIRNGREIHAAYRMLLEQRGICLAENEAFPGKDLFGILSNIKLKYNLRASVEDLALERRENYLKIINESDVTCCAGVKELFQILNQLKTERDIRVAYTSSSEKAFIDVLLKKLFYSCELDSYIEDPDSFFYHADGQCASTCWREGLGKKPASDIYDVTLAKLNLDSRQCIAFEDSLSGFQAARFAELRVVVVPSENEEDSFKSFGFDLVHSDYIKLHTLFDFYQQLESLYGHKISKV